MAGKKTLEAQNPLILRSHRLMDAFAKSDDERDFYLERQEGYIVYVDLDKPKEELDELERVLEKDKDNYCLIPKFTFYEAKKIMEGFVNEKVYDIDTKEKLLDIIQSKEARENFLEFIYDHHAELEKWHLYYQERSRIRIIEWLRNNNFTFVFEEDLDLQRNVVEKVKQELFETKVGKDVANARKALFAKAKTYYSNEALNPRPKRGRPPKQAAKQEVETQVSTDIYTTVQPAVRPFLYIPDITSPSAVTFSAKFDDEQALSSRRQAAQGEHADELGTLQQKLATLRSLSNKWIETEKPKNAPEEDFLEEEEENKSNKAGKSKEKAIASAKKKMPLKKIRAKNSNNVAKKAPVKANPTSAIPKKPINKFKSLKQTQKSMSKVKPKPASTKRPIKLKKRK